MQSLSSRSTEELLARKDELVRALIITMKEHGLAVEYAVDLAASAKSKGIAQESYLRLLETLLEIESIKYTLAARRVRELAPDDA